MANPKQIYSKDAKWRKNVLRSLVTDVIAYGQIKTTKARAKLVAQKVDKMITKAKKNTLATRRQAAAYLRDITIKNKKQTVLQYLFAILGPKYQSRNGGYVRVINLPSRAGDNAKMALVQLV